MFIRASREFIYNSIQQFVRVFLKVDIQKTIKLYREIKRTQLERKAIRVRVEQTHALKCARTSGRKGN